MPEFKILKHCELNAQAWLGQQASTEASLSAWIHLRSEFIIVFSEIPKIAMAKIESVD